MVPLCQVRGRRTRPRCDLGRTRGPVREQRVPSRVVCDITALARRQLRGGRRRWHASGRSADDLVRSGRVGAVRLRRGRRRSGVDAQRIDVVSRSGPTRRRRAPTGGAGCRWPRELRDDEHRALRTWRRARTRLTGNARRSQAKARREGADVERTSDPAPFLKLYTAAAEQWAMQYPSALIEQVLANGAAECHNVVREGEVIGSGLALRGGTHWMYWLAAQNQEGRSRHSGYLSVDSVLRTACARGGRLGQPGRQPVGRSRARGRGGVQAAARCRAGSGIGVHDGRRLGWAMLRAERLARRALGPARRRVRAALR